MESLENNDRTRSKFMDWADWNLLMKRRVWARRDNKTVSGFPLFSQEQRSIVRTISASVIISVEE